MVDCWGVPVPASTFMETPASAGLSPLLLFELLDVESLSSGWQLEASVLFVQQKAILAWSRFTETAWRFVCKGRLR